MEGECGDGRGEYEGWRYEGIGSLGVSGDGTCVERLYTLNETALSPVMLTSRLQGMFSASLCR